MNGIRNYMPHTPVKSIAKAHFDQDRFAQIVAARRIDEQLSLRDLGNMIGVSAATLSRIEAGRHPSIDAFGQICEWLRVNPAEFFYTDEDAEVTEA